EQLRDRVPDIMLVDIEMPRMDGYELTTRIRSDARLRHIPIIMITSRAGAKHKQRALDIGVDDYMSKPYQEDELFRNIDKLLSMARGDNA
ncbi:MAG: response regulator, partial [Pseudomonadota bacterium]